MDLKDNILQVNNLHVAYAGKDVLKGVSLSVERGQMISIVGANGSGKTTLLNAVSGMHLYENCRITGGEVLFKGKSIHNLSPLDIIREGIVHILEGRREFSALTIEENLVLGAVARHGKPAKTGIEMIYDYFPTLMLRRKNLAASCGIGELQMLAIGRALMSQPEMILLDEPYQRMAPILAHELFTVIKKINRDMGITVIFVERNIGISFQTADNIYSMADGKLFPMNNVTTGLSDYNFPINQKDFR
jgi:branched-chain amino acid transport system ATP-binding protein